LKVINFYINFRSRLDENNAKFESLPVALTALKKNSAKFNKVIEIILAIGNFLNYGHIRLGDAPAYYMTKLHDNLSILKSNEGPSLLNYIVSFCDEFYPELIHWTEDLLDVRAALKFDFGSFLTELEGIEKEFDKITEILSTIVQTDYDKDVFLSKMHEKFTETKSELSHIRKRMDEFEQESKKFLASLCVPIDINISTFFKDTLIPLMDKFDIEKTSYHSVKEKKKKDTIRDHKKKLLEAKQKLFGSERTFNIKMNSENVVEDTIKALKTGEHSNINRERRKLENLPDTEPNNDVNKGN